MVRPSIATILSICAVALLAGCAPSLEPTVRRPSSLVRPVPAGDRVRVVLVVPENRNRLRTPGAVERVDDAPQILRDYLVRAVVEHGCETADEADVDRMVEREFPGGRDLTDGQAAKVAHEFRGDVVVFGRLDAWARGHLYGRSTTVAFRLDVLDSSGAQIARVVHSGTAAQEDPADLARILASQAADSLVAAIGGCAREP